MLAKFCYGFILLTCVLSAVSCSNPPPAPGTGIELGASYEFVHPGKLHEVHISDVALAAGADGKPVIAWTAEVAGANNVYIARLERGVLYPVRVNPDGMSADSVHQSPGIAVGSEGEIYISWSASKPKPEGALFASDLILSRSLDGGRNFDNHLRINEDRPISHSFEGMDVASDGSVLISWIDTREGWDKPATFIARIGSRGTSVESAVKLAGDVCVCCRVDLGAGENNRFAVLWRQVFAEDARDMVISTGADSVPPSLVHADNWKIAACPHRGGSVGIDGGGTIYASWYTEGAGEPNVLFAKSRDGREFSAPRRLDESKSSIPDHVSMAVGDGALAIAWEDSTAVRRRIVLRYSTDGGKSFSPIETLSGAIKSYAPDIAASAGGNFFVVWSEEQFPHVKTVVREVRLKTAK